MVNSDTGRLTETRYIRERARRLEEKLDSNTNKLHYLIKKINHLTKARQTGAGQDALTQDRLIKVAERLRRIGLVIEYTDGRGVMKLKAIDQKGLDNLKRLNTVFTVSMIESFLENVVD